MLNTSPELTNILAWLLFGLVTGTVVHVIDPGPNRGGLLGTIITGVLGAVVGGFLANMLFGLSVTGFNLESFVIAIIGGLLLAGLYRLVTREQGPRLNRG